MTLTIFLLSVTFMGVDSARILGVFPMPSISHQVVFRTLTLELANRGHELVIITPNPALPKERPKDNVTEIDISNSYRLLKDQDNKGHVNVAKRGVIIDVDAMMADKTIQGLFYLMAELFNSPEVNLLLQDKNQRFDLVIAEAMLYFHLIFAKIYNAPVILMSSFYGFADLYETIGAPARHPLLYPNALRNNFRTLTVFERIKELYYEIRLFTSYGVIDDMENTLLKNKFGEDAPTVKELKNCVNLLFLNSFPIFDNNRPVPPNVVYLGGLHLQTVKELPKDLKYYLDNSKRGVVYVSLGTNVHSSMMAQDLIDAFLGAFEKLPYDILWKFDEKFAGKVPKNVLIQKWLPQRDLLVHPNIKVFVTQGGIQSTDEAIDSGVPLVGIPILGDQWYNVNKYIELGIGVQLDALTLSADDLVTAVKRVIGDDRFRENIKRVKNIMYDQPQKPLERAVWWTEYLLRHDGARHLRAPAANMTYWEYLMADVLLIMAATIFTFLLAITFLLYYVIKYFTKKSLKVKRS